MQKKINISEWVEKCINQNQWENNDIHIDEVYGEIPRENWVAKGIDLLASTKSEINDPDFIIILSIPLKFTKINVAMPKSLDSIQADDLSSTPPSLYIVNKHSIRWSKVLSKEKVISQNRRHTCFFSQTLEDDIMYSWIYVLFN